MTEALHPRDTFAYDGGEGVEAAFLEAQARGRLHHAWLLTGPEGVGKATFAYRAARRLLGARPDPRFGLLGSNPDDPVSRQVSSRSHPDLMVLEREGEDGKARKYIAVDDARRLPEFFAKAPGSAPFRVAIIDAADDMNINAANALLKTLEEPPTRGVLFLVSHAPGGLIATIRSRCRRLAFPAWSEERTQAFVEARTGLPADQALRLARMSRGAPGRAVAMAQEGALDAEAVAQEILRRLPAVDEAALLAVADSFRGAEGAKRPAAGRGPCPGRGRGGGRRIGRSRPLGPGLGDAERHSARGGGGEPRSFRRLLHGHRPAARGGQGVTGTAC
jgi:DNA polymerase-3 subunit delta'